MPNIKRAIDHPSNPEWISLEFDDGTKSHLIHDPTGSFRKQAAEVTAKLQGQPPNAMQQAAAGLAGVSAAPGAPPPAPPVTSAPIPAQPVSPALPAATAQATAPMAVAPTEPAAAQPIARSEPAPGLMRSGENRQVTGLTAESQQKIDSASADAIKAQKEADDAANEAKTQQVNAEWARLTEEEKANLAKTAQEEQKAREMEARVSRHTAELKEISERPIDPAKAFEGERGWYAFMAVMGDALMNFGAALNGRGNVADAGKTVEAMINRSVNLQTEQRALEHKQGLITSDQLLADQERVRVNLATAYAQQAKIREAKAKTDQERMALGAMSKHAEAMRAKAIADAAKATAQQETRVEEFSVPKPVTGAAGLPRGPIEDELRAMGISKEDYTKALTSKVGSAGENAPTAASTAQFVKAADADLAAMQTLMVDGVLPNKLASNQIKDVTRAALQRLGIPLETDGSADLAAFNQLYTRRLIAEAKKMGGVITKNDLDFTEKVAGQTPQSIRAWLTRMRNDANNELRAHLGAHFPDYTQRVADIMLRGQSSTTGVPGTNPEPFEKTNVEHTGPEAPKFEDTPLERENKARVEQRSQVLDPLREAERERQRKLRMGAGRFGY